jgi:hypothetical protein
VGACDVCVCVCVCLLLLSTSLFLCCDYFVFFHVYCSVTLTYFVNLWAPLTSVPRFDVVPLGVDVLGNVALPGSEEAS